MVDADKDRRRDRDKGFDPSQRYFEGLFIATDAFENLQGFGLSPAQLPGGQDGEMGRQVRKVGMEFAPEVLDELSCGVFQIRHQRVTRILHAGQKLYAARETGVRSLGAGRVTEGTSPKSRGFAEKPGRSMGFSVQNKTPPARLERGTYVDQPSPKCCSRRRLNVPGKSVNGPGVLYPELVQMGRLA